MQPRDLSARRPEPMRMAHCCFRKLHTGLCDWQQYNSDATIITVLPTVKLLWPPVAAEIGAAQLECLEPGLP